jgi:hypothetical protein
MFPHVRTLEAPGALCSGELFATRDTVLNRRGMMPMHQMSSYRLDDQAPSAWKGR